MLTEVGLDQQSPWSSNYRVDKHTWLVDGFRCYDTSTLDIIIQSLDIVQLLNVIQLLCIIQSLNIIQLLDITYNIIKTPQKCSNNVLTTYKYWSRIGFRPDSPSLKIIFSEKIWNVSQPPSTERHHELGRKMLTEVGLDQQSSDPQPQLLDCLEIKKCQFVFTIRATKHRISCHFRASGMSWKKSRHANSLSFAERKIFGGSIAQHQTTLVIQILAKSAKARPKVSWRKHFDCVVSSWWRLTMETSRFTATSSPSKNAGGSTRRHKSFSTSILRAQCA